MKLKVTVDQIEYEIDVEIKREAPSLPPIAIGGSGGAPAAALIPSVIGAAGTNVVVAPLTGPATRILVAESDEVEASQALLVLEVMKMGTGITASTAGVVSVILVKPSEPVQGGQGFIEL